MDSFGGAYARRVTQKNVFIIEISRKKRKNSSVTIDIFYNACYAGIVD